MTFLVDGTNGGTFPSWTTSTRPASPAVGQMGYNTTTGLFDQYTAGGWVSSLTSASQSIPFAALPTGSVLQVVQGVNGTTLSTTSGSFQLTGLTSSITPKFSTSKILVMLSAELRTSPNAWMQVALYRNASIQVYINTGMHYQVSSTTTTQPGYMYLDSPATTSSTSYTLAINAQNGGTAQYCPDGVSCTITLMEIAA